MNRFRGCAVAIGVEHAKGKLSCKPWLDACRYTRDDWTTDRHPTYASEYKQSTNDFTAPSMPDTFGLFDSMT
jgi:hypothetical protein